MAHPPGAEVRFGGLASVSTAARPEVGSAARAVGDCCASLAAVASVAGDALGPAVSGAVGLVSEVPCLASQPDAAGGAPDDLAIVDPYLPSGTEGAVLGVVATLRGAAAPRLVLPGVLDTVALAAGEDARAASAPAIIQRDRAGAPATGHGHPLAVQQAEKLRLEPPGPKGPSDEHVEPCCIGGSRRHDFGVQQIVTRRLLAPADRSGPGGVSDAILWRDRFDGGACRLLGDNLSKVMGAGRFVLRHRECRRVVHRRTVTRPTPSSRRDSRYDRPTERGRDEPA